MNGAAERVGDALLRAPYAWLITTSLFFLIMLTSLSGIAEEVGEGSAPLAIAAAVVVAIQGVGGLLLMPGRLAAVRRTRSEGEAATQQWAFAVAPFLAAWGAVAAGAERWVLSAGVFVSAVLLVSAARAFRRGTSD